MTTEERRTQYQLLASNAVRNNMQTVYEKYSAFHYIPWVKKTGQSILAHNFGKCWPIFKILSPSLRGYTTNVAVECGRTLHK